MTSRRFRNRAEAGALLGRRLREHNLAEPVVVGLPRGGIPVAAEIARALTVPLDVVVVRKLGVPWQPELALGGVGEGGVRVLNPEIAGQVPAQDVEALTRRATAEVARSVAAWRGDRPAEQLNGRTVVLVDDGIATGATARAAVEVLRARGAERIVLAVPVIAHVTAERLRTVVEELVTLAEPEHLGAVGNWYDDFRQVPDDEVRALLSHALPQRAPERAARTTEEAIPFGAGTLPAQATVPHGASGVVLFAHGSGSSRLSPRNAAVAERLNTAGLATVLLDLLTAEEATNRAMVFDVGLLAGRLLDATRWAASADGLQTLPLGYFGASTGAAAALWAAADQPQDLRAVVSRGGRPDLAGPRLADVRVPTLLIVGQRDHQVLELNREAQRLLRCPSRLDVVPGATHLFEEPGTLDAAANLAAAWFTEHLVR